MHRIAQRSAYLCLVVFAIWFSFSRDAHAVSVSPGRVVLQARPGQVLTGFFDLGNPDHDLADIQIEPEDWAQGMNGQRGPVSWLTVNPSHVVLKPGKHARVKYTIRVPKQAIAELRTQVFFTTLVKGTTGIRSRLGSIIYVVITGTERLGGTITQMHVSYAPSTPDTAKPDRLDVALRIHNQSNIHILPEGEIVVRNSEGNTVATIPLPPGWGLLPNEEDLYHALGHGISLKAGRYTIEATIHCGHDVQHPMTMTKTVDVVVTADGRLHQ